MKYPNWETYTDEQKQNAVDAELKFDPNSTFAIGGLIDPIQVFENGVYAGLIMPMRANWTYVWKE
ncbi:MAG TPA: hypothetical protein PKL77_06055 [Candidatus Omnitrophota bacterium]|nr:hypothetical protein [Candidatus Omnitrophota bacterium]